MGVETADGQARTFEDMAKAVFNAAGKAPDIEYTPMPPAIRDKYQYFTQAETSKLRAAGAGRDCLSLEDGVRAYVRFLSEHDRRGA